MSAASVVTDKEKAKEDRRLARLADILSGRAGVPSEVTGVVPDHRGGEVELYQCTGCNVQVIELPEHWVSTTQCGSCWECPNCLDLYRFEPEDDYVCWTCRYGNSEQSHDESVSAHPSTLTGLDRFALPETEYDQAMNRGDKVPPDPNDDSFFLA